MIFGTRSENPDERAPLAKPDSSAFLTEITRIFQSVFKFSGFALLPFDSRSAQFGFCDMLEISAQIIGPRQLVFISDLEIQKKSINR
jgi:hypothetical protein